MLLLMIFIYVKMLIMCYF